MFDLSIREACRDKGAAGEDSNRVGSEKVNIVAEGVRRVWVGFANGGSDCVCNF